jgi:hypothetical protein
MVVLEWLFEPESRDKASASYGDASDVPLTTKRLYGNYLEIEARSGTGAEDGVGSTFIRIGDVFEAIYYLTKGIH